jgi:hypothetical protein
LPAIFVVWANVHIQFAYGLLILGLACAAPVLDSVLHSTDPTASASVLGSRGWLRVVGLTTVCSAATLVNPYQVRLYAVMLDYATQPEAFRLVQELSAPDFREVWNWVALALLLSAAIALGRRPSLGAFDILLLAAGAYLGFHARRDLWFVFLVSVAILVRTPILAAPRGEHFAWTPLRQLGLAGLMILIMVTGCYTLLKPAAMQEAIARRFPVEAAAAVERAGCAGPLYNHFNWGGYLIWRLPQYPVAIDGRTNLHGDDRLDRSFDTWRGVKGWQDDPELMAAGVVIAESRGALTSLLRLDARFRILHEDDVAVVFVRSSGSTHRDLSARSSR